MKGNALNKLGKYFEAINLFNLFKFKIIKVSNKLLN